MTDRVVEADGVSLKFTNLDKELYPDVTKAEIIEYYYMVAEVMLPHLRDRPATRIRYPNGVAGPSFFEKNSPKGTPSWVRLETLAVPGSTMNRDTIDFVVIDDRPTLLWCANLAAIELHVPQWRIADGKDRPDLLVLDLDPGPGTALPNCCALALLLQEALAEDGLTAYAKTSGKKGLQVYAELSGKDELRVPSGTSAYAHTLAERLEREYPSKIVSRMDKSLRAGRVLIDWSQNNSAKTTVAPYSLRATDKPQVSTPITWEEVASCRSAADLIFSPADVVKRVGKDGDLFAPLLPNRS